MKTYSILFIGNSYTFYSDMPTSIFKPLAESYGYYIEVQAITKGGYTLSQFADADNAYGKQVNEALSGSKKYDYVILQEQSLRPANADAPKFHDAVRELAKKIRAIGATPILYKTWGRKSGCPTLEEYGWTNESMTNLLSKSYEYIGNELNIKVANVGNAFYKIYTNEADIDLYDEDMSHPSYSGSFLAASIFASP